MELNRRSLMLAALAASAMGGYVASPQTRMEAVNG